MNVLNKAVIQTLKKNRIRTIVTIIGIMLSTALICAVTSSAVSFIDFGKKSVLYMNGDWHASADGDKNTLEIIRNSPEVEEYSISYPVKTANYHRADKDIDERWLIIPVTDNYYDMLSIRLINGRYPQNSRELVLGDSFLRLRPELSIGSEVTLSLGEYKSKDEEQQPEFEAQEERTYTIVGVSDETSREYAAVFCAYDPEDNVSYKYAGRSTVFFRMNDPADTYDFIGDNHFYGQVNDELLMFYGVSLDSNLLVFIMTVILIIVCLIALGAISLIDNAFSISISERTKQFGLLSSIGATKKQLRRMVFFEALVISIIAIPLGIALGLSGIGITFKLLGGRFGSLMDVPFAITLKVSPSAIAGAVIVSLVIVLLSAWAPAARATKMSAVEAIRQNNDVQNSKKLRRTPKITAKLFGLPGVLATKHFRCNKKRCRTTIFSLFLSIVLFISASAFTMYLVEAANQEYRDGGCDILFTCNKESDSGRTPDELYAAVKNTDGVTDAAYAFCISHGITYDSQDLTEEALSRYGTDGSGKTIIETLIVCLNDEEYRELLREYDLSESEYLNKNAPLAIACDESDLWDGLNDKYISMDVFKTDKAEGYASYISQNDEGANGIDLGDGNVRYRNKDSYTDLPLTEVEVKVPVKIGTTISEPPYYAYGDDTVPLVLIYPASTASELLPEYSRFNMLSYFVMTSDHRTASDALEELLISSGNKYYDFIDKAAEVEAVNNIVLIVKVFSFGFIIMISLIAAANVFNTITTNVNLRRREFAMLRSVGMSAREINRMMNFECLMYGAKALMYGLPVSFGVTYLIYLAERGAFSIVYHIPWWAVAASVLSVFVVVFAAMLYSMSKIKKDNPIDALKNENV